VNIESFIEELEVSIDGIEPDSLTPETCFRELPAWDSLAVLGTLAVFDGCFGKQISAEQLKECETIADIYRLSQ